MTLFAPIKYLFRPHRRTIDPATLGKASVFHYSLPAWHEHGDGQFEPASEIASLKLLLSGSELLISKLNPEKAVIIMPETHDCLTVSSTELVALVPVHVDRRFGFYLLSSQPIRDRLKASVESVTNSHKRARVDRFLASKFAVPDLPTQKAIAAFLDRETARIDQLIEKKQSFLALLQDKKTTWLSQLIGGLGVGGGEDWLAGCPLDWPRRRAKFVFRERDERSVDGAEDLLTASHLTGISRRAEKDVNMFLAETNVGYKKVFAGDFVINTMWAWMGAMGVSTLEGIISPSYGVYRPTADDFEPRYFDLISRSKPFVAEATRRSKGIHSSRLRLYPDAFLDMRLPIPPTSVQRELLADYDRQLSHEQHLSVLTEASIDRLKEYRSALITSAVTGQIDVETWSRRGEGDRRLDRIKEEMAG